MEYIVRAHCGSSLQRWLAEHRRSSWLFLDSGGYPCNVDSRSSRHLTVLRFVFPQLLLLLLLEEIRRPGLTTRLSRNDGNGQVHLCLLVRLLFGSESFALLCSKSAEAI